MQAPWSVSLRTETYGDQLAALQLRGSVQTVIELRKSDVEGDINNEANSRDSVSCTIFVDACAAHGLVSTPINGHINKKQRGWTSSSTFTTDSIKQVSVSWDEPFTGIL